MATLTIDGIEVTVEDGCTVLQACEQAGIEVPRFCFHDRLSIAGNCRMCLVEQERAPKPVASCAQPVMDGMVIHTNSEKVKKARKGVMEFLLINHPLDCPICDQGGECDLQDQAMAYGYDRSRFQENKRAVKDKNLGPLVKTIMTRCIHCTRCVRFATEIAGVEELGATGRGEDTEIGTYVNRALSSELSGNLVDLCPVGALTSKPYAFMARSWELRKTEGIDVHDAVGSNVRIDARGREVMRILPRIHEDINEEWISDKTRHAVDGLKRQRLDRPYVRRNGKLQPASWNEAFSAIFDRLKQIPTEEIGGRVAAIAGDMVDVETLVAMGDILDVVGSPNRECRQDGAAIDPNCRAGYLFNPTIAGLEQADAILIVGSNPRWEASLINARIRKRWLASPLPVGLIGEAVDLTYDYEHLGAGPDQLDALINGDGDFADALKAAERPVILLGAGALARPDGAAILAQCRTLAEAVEAVSEDWNGFALLHDAAARVGALDVGFVPGEGGRDLAGILAGAQAGDIDLVWLLGADEFDTQKLGQAFVVYQGHHGDAGAHRADVILPGAAYCEKSATWVNTEGRPQRGTKAVDPPGDAREDWTILRAFSAVIGHPLPYDNIHGLRARMVEIAPQLDELDVITPADWGDFGAAGDIEAAPFTASIGDFYITNPICRASATMAECSRLFVTQEKATGTDG